jgi:hypothetical protein
MSVMKYVPCRDCGRPCSQIRCRACNYAAARATGNFQGSGLRMRCSPWTIDSLGHKVRVLEGLGAPPGEPV